jgi:hypothetical protein
MGDNGMEWTEGASRHGNGIGEMDEGRQLASGASMSRSIHRDNAVVGRGKWRDKLGHLSRVATPAMDEKHARPCAPFIGSDQLIPDLEDDPLRRGQHRMLLLTIAGVRWASEQ